MEAGRRLADATLLVQEGDGKHGRTPLGASPAQLHGAIRRPPRLKTIGAPGRRTSAQLHGAIRRLPQSQGIGAITRRNYMAQLGPDVQLVECESHWIGDYLVDALPS